jgi:hypothetical protein
MADDERGPVRRQTLIYMPCSRRFYPKWLTVVRAYIWHMDGPGNWTHNPDVANAMRYQLSHTGSQGQAGRHIHDKNWNGTVVHLKFFIWSVSSKTTRSSNLFYWISLKSNNAFDRSMWSLSEELEKWPVGGGAFSLFFLATSMWWQNLRRAIVASQGTCSALDCDVVPFIDSRYVCTLTHGHCVPELLLV